MHLEGGSVTLVEDINGKGMEIAVHLGKTKTPRPLVDLVVEKAQKRGLHLVSDHGNNIQIMPPLTIERKDLDKGVEILIEALQKN